MKRLAIIVVIIFCLVMADFAIAAIITINLDSIPTALDCDTECLCDQNWIVSDIILEVTSIYGNDCLADGCNPDDCNHCNWEHGVNLDDPSETGILLNPGRLIVDLDAVVDKIIRIDVETEDYCLPENYCTFVYVYSSTGQWTASSLSGKENFSFRTLWGKVNKLVVAMCNGFVNEIRIITSKADPTSSTCGTDCGGATWTTCGMGCGVTFNTCGMSCPTNNTCNAADCGVTFNTCSPDCSGTTWATCGIGCGSTLNTCDTDCSSVTSSTCGIGCATTLDICAGAGGYWITLHTCGPDCGWPTYLTRGIGCGTTYNPCSIGCVTTFSLPYSAPTVPPSF